MEELEYPFASDLLCRVKKIKKQLQQQEHLITKKVAILCGTTVGQLRGLIEIFMLNQGFQPEMYEGQYNNFFEEAVFGVEDLDRFQPEVVYIHTTVRNILEWPEASDTEVQIEDKLNALINKFVRVWDSLQNKYGCIIVQNNFEMLPYRIMGNMDRVHITGRQYFIDEANRRLVEEMKKRTAVFLNDIHYQSAYFGLENWFDDSDWCVFKYPFSRDAFAMTAHNIVNIIKSYYGRNKKAIVVDLDQTLWKGIIGDDGVNGIEIGIESPEGMLHREFQQYLKEIRDRGIVLAICSKNESDAAELGLSHASSILKPEDFTITMCNWERKSSNIYEIGRKLNLNVDSFVFIDDNPAERQEVKENVESINVLPVTDISNMRKILDMSGYFEITNYAAEDLERNNLYKANLERELAANKMDYEEYLKTLDMKVKFENVCLDNIERVTQLLNKTNQFNLTGFRPGRSEIEKIAHRNVTICGTLNDKYGNNGLVSVMLAKINGNTFSIEISAWVMSCRVFKRNLELAMFDRLVEISMQKGIHIIRGIYIPTKKNRLVATLYEKLGFSLKEDKMDYQVWEYEIPKKYKKKNNIIQVCEL